MSNTWKFLLITALATGLAACDVEQEQEGDLPDVDVQAEEGQLPEYDVETPDVEVRQDTVTVPEIDIEEPGDEGL